jgi:hypothetical protein
MGLAPLALLPGASAFTFHLLEITTIKNVSKFGFFGTNLSEIWFFIEAPCIPMPYKGYGNK